MNRLGFRGTEIATSTAIRRWIKGWRAHANDGPWYVAYLYRCATVMQVVRNRDEATDVACGMLDEGIEVTGVGPLLDTSQEKIDRASLEEISQQRRRVEMRNGIGIVALAGAER